MIKNQIILFAFCMLVMNTPSLLLMRVYAEEKVQAYNGSSSVTLNNNVPSFSKEEITKEAYEQYGNLDYLGRCTIAQACIDIKLMPTEDRGSIGTVKPSGWNQNKYPGIVNSEPPYLYNRCHLIGYQLTGENANERNLITGTRYMNVEGMLPYENKVSDYIKATNNHVMYRVTPVFTGENLLCDGVQIEALSVEDNGKGICFNVFCYNVQPGVMINYADGSNYADPQYTSKTESKEFMITAEEKNGHAARSNDKGEYVANRNTKKFHHTDCGSVTDIKEKNKVNFEGTRNELIEQGYQPCKRCNP